MEEYMKHKKCQQNFESQKAFGVTLTIAALVEEFTRSKAPGILPCTSQMDSFPSCTMARLKVEGRYPTQSRKILSKSVMIDWCEIMPAVFPNSVPEHWQSDLYQSGWELKGTSLGNWKAQRGRKGINRGRHLGVLPVKWPVPFWYPGPLISREDILSSLHTKSTPEFFPAYLVSISR